MDTIRFINLEFFFQQVAEFFTEITSPATRAGSFVGSGFWEIFWFVIRVVLPLAILLLFIIWVYYLIRIEEIHDQEEHRLLERIYRRQESDVQTPANKKWEFITQLFRSSNPNDWRVAVMESDILLDQLMDSLGYEGETLGEKLKAADPGNFPTLQQAWDAHLVRNQIAHDGSDFQLDRQEANRVFRLYERVFTDARFV